MAIIIVGLLAFSISQIFVFSERRGQALNDLENLKTELQKAQADQGNLQDELQYYLNPQNFEKELKSRFNYRDFQEKMIIIVPNNAN